MLLIFNQQGVHCGSYFIPGTQVVVIPTLFLQSSRHLQQYTTCHLSNTIVGEKSLIFNLAEYLSWFLWIDGNCIWDITELPGRMIRTCDILELCGVFVTLLSVWESTPHHCCSFCPLIHEKWKEHIQHENKIWLLRNYSFTIVYPISII